MIPRYSVSEYQSLLMQSQNKFLLVEGPSDKHLFEVLLNEFFHGEGGRAGRQSRLKIDSASDIVLHAETALGNREVIEHICKVVAGTDYEYRFVGFVDREFREFDREPLLRDHLTGHRVTGRCVWSRGHSVENYFFDFEALRRPFRGCSVGADCKEALDLFERVFESAIRLACTASLAAHDVNQMSNLGRSMLDLVKGSLDWRVIDISDDEATLNITSWQRKLLGQNATPEMSDGLLERFEFWDEKVQAAEFSVVRWMCHGHIGFGCIWAVYTRCVYQTCPAANDAERSRITQKVVQTQETDRFGLVVEDWVSRALGNQGEYPIEVLRLLGLPLT